MSSVHPRVHPCRSGLAGFGRGHARSARDSSDGARSAGGRGLRALAGTFAIATAPFAFVLAAQAEAPDRLAKGIEMFWSGRYAETIEALTPVCDSDVRDDERLECWKYVAFSRVALNDPEGAADAFVRLLDVDPAYALDETTVSPKILVQFEDAKQRVAEQLFERAKAAYAEGRYTGASEIFGRVLEVDPEHAVAKEYVVLASERAAILEAESRPRAESPEEPLAGEGGAPEAAVPPREEEETLDAPDDRVYHLTSRMTPPSLTSRVNPTYPVLAQRAGREGTVVLAAVVTREGDVRDVRVVGSVTPELDRAAREAVSRWKYEPARLDSRAVAVHIVVNLTFALR